MRMLLLSQLSVLHWNFLLLFSLVNDIAVIASTIAVVAVFLFFLENVTLALLKIAALVSLYRVSHRFIHF